MLLVGEGVRVLLRYLDGPVGQRLVVLRKFRRSRLFTVTMIDWLLNDILRGWG